MEEAFINQISGEQHSARYKKDLPILRNNRIGLQNTLNETAWHVKHNTYLLIL